LLDDKNFVKGKIENLKMKPYHKIISHEKI
jgi:hypothetical protein